MGSRDPKLPASTKEHFAQIMGWSEQPIDSYLISNWKNGRYSRKAIREDLEFRKSLLSLLQSMRRTDRHFADGLTGLTSVGSVSGIAVLAGRGLQYDLPNANKLDRFYEIVCKHVNRFTGLLINEGAESVRTKSEGQVTTYFRFTP